MSEYSFFFKYQINNLFNSIKEVNIFKIKIIITLPSSLKFDSDLLVDEARQIDDGLLLLALRFVFLKISF